MSWAMPTVAGQWPSGITMPTPDMNMGNYTPEQWTALQQQNWQQWAQWQQQYAQWQTQYGEKYAQQMQAMQSMGGMPPGGPPLPSSGVAQPAPPPPDKPPPPPPDQNNQPLFGNTMKQPVPVPPPANRNTISGYNNSNFSGNNQSWSQGAADSHQEASQGAAAVNAEALKKLAEEERLFDIQFQKWEEEIEKWKKENVNHPDKEAYKEYEAKFESCRVQLLERRRQMNQRKARLLGQAPPASGAPTGKAQTSALPSLMQIPINKPTFNQNVQSQGYNNSPSSNYLNQKNTAKQYNDAPSAFNRNANKNVDPQDRYEAYQTIEDYSESGNDFLPASANNKGIPGLDLVPDSDKSTNKQDVIDITEEKPHSVPPDYSKISKGINNILGDAKIMNILSMVKIQAPGGNNNAQSLPGGSGDLERPIGPAGPGGHNSGPIGRGVGSGPGGSYGSNSNNFDNNHQWDTENNQDNNHQFANQQNRSFNRQGPPPLMQQIVNPPSLNRMHNDDQRGMPLDQYYDRNSHYRGGPNMGSMPPGGRPNMPQGRPPLQEMSGHQNMNDLYRGSHDNSGGMHNDRTVPMLENRIPMNQPPPRAKWLEDPLFTPSLIVEYEHKPLRLKAREFIEPVHTFDYNHISKDEEYKKKNFEREIDELFTRKPRRLDDDYTPDRSSRFFNDGGDRFSADRGERFPVERGDRFPLSGDRFSREQPLPRDFERRPREEIRDDIRLRAPPRDEYEDRKRPELAHFDRRRDDRDKFPRRDDYRDREDYSNREDFRDREDYRSREDFRDREDHRSREDLRDREEHRSRDDFRDRERDRYRDARRDDVSLRSRSRERDSRKRGRSRESEASEHSKKSKDNDNKSAPADGPKHVVMIDDILESPGREMRPEKIVIILRGPPGSGKSYLAKLIRDREAEYGGTSRIMSIDDYFMQEGEIEEKDPNTGKIIKKPTIKYEYDENLEETYINSLKRAFKRSLTDGYFSFLIYDAVNDQLKSYADIWNYARQNGFQVYVITMELDPQICFKRNTHGRTLTDIEVVCSRFFPTPAHHIELDATTLLQSGAIDDVTMEDADPPGADSPGLEVETSFTSKWERMDNIDKLARLDGTSKPLRPSQLSMEDYLQIDDWKPNKAQPGKKTVRWADIEERRQQEKMRAIGFVVGQTDWNRMTDPTMGSSALTQTKYIERVRRNQFQ